MGSGYLRLKSGRERVIRGNGFDDHHVTVNGRKAREDLEGLYRSVKEGMRGFTVFRCALDEHDLH